MGKIQKMKKQKQKQIPFLTIYFPFFLQFVSYIITVGPTFKCQRETTVISINHQHQKSYGLISHNNHRGYKNWREGEEENHSAQNPNFIPSLFSSSFSFPFLLALRFTLSVLGKCILAIFTPSSSLWYFNIFYSVKMMGNLNN